MEKVQTSLKQGCASEDLGLGGPMLFCTTCFNRQPQLLAALAVNLALAFPFRRCVKFCVLLLGDDDHGTWRIIQDRFEKQLDEGWLLVASGGAAGTLHAETVGKDAPPWMPTSPGGLGPGGSCGPERLRYWHASWAKNGAHQFAMWAVGSQAKVLVNLDCDNLMTPEYITGVAMHFRRGQEVKGLCVVCKSVEGALTGRLAYRPVDFRDIRGYDTEGTEPAASEDVDIRERLLALAEKAYGSKDRSIQRPCLVGSAQCGGALPNDFDDLSFRMDRNIAKLKNCDPLLLQKHGDQPAKRFNKMCEVAWQEIYQMRLLQGRIVRNDTLACRDQPWWCCWWTCLRRPKASDQGSAGASTGAAGEAEPTVVPKLAAVLPKARPQTNAAETAGPQPTLTPAQKPKVNVNIVWAGLKFLQYIRRTGETFPHIQLPFLVSPLQPLRSASISWSK